MYFTFFISFRLATYIDTISITVNISALVPLKIWRQFTGLILRFHFAKHAAFVRCICMPRKKNGANTALIGAYVEIARLPLQRSRYVQTYRSKKLVFCSFGECNQAKQTVDYLYQLLVEGCGVEHVKEPTSRRWICNATLMWGRT